MLAVASPCSSTSPAAKLGKALLRCFEHRSEACRDMSASCFMKLLQVDADSTLSMLPYAMPVLVERLQCDEVSSRTPQGTAQTTCSKAKQSSQPTPGQYCVCVAWLMLRLLPHILPIGTLFAVPQSCRAKRGSQASAAAAAELDHGSSRLCHCSLRLGGVVHPVCSPGRQLP